MSETVTNLAAEDIAYIKAHLGEWLAEQSLGKPPAVCEIELRERMVPPKEEIKHQRELIKSILEQLDKRFDELTRRIDRFMVWSFAAILTVGSLVVAALKLWP